MKQTDYRSQTVGQIVASDFGASAVFARLGIDFCCHGGVMFGEACRQKGLDPAEVERELCAHNDRQGAGACPFAEWPTDLLVDYVLKIHHRNIRERGPQTAQLLGRVVEVHGSRHPELAEVARLFSQSLADLDSHLSKEEQVLFPYIYELFDAHRRGTSIAPFGCGTVEHPIAVMEMEHSGEGERFERIAALTADFAAPADACASYALAMQQLRQFRDALHEHIHLENNIIFPRAVALEPAVAMG